MNWWKAHHGIATDLKYAVVLRHIQKSAPVTGSNALRDVTNASGNGCPVTRSNIVSVWVWLIDFSSQNSPRGSIDGIEIDEIAASLDLSDEVVSVILDALRWKGMISGNLLTAFEKRQPLNDKTNAERQARHRNKLKQETESNALRNGTNALPLARGDGDGDGEVLVVNEHLPTTEVFTDGRTKRAGRENGAAFGLPHETVRPSDRPTDIERISFMRDAIYGYMSMAGTPYQRNCNPPDDAIVLQCLGAVGSADMRRVADFLRDRFVNSEQSPRHPNGPRKYAWFVSVLTEQFGGHAKNGRQAQR